MVLKWACTFHSTKILVARSKANYNCECISKVAYLRRFQLFAFILVVLLFFLCKLFSSSSCSASIQVQKQHLLTESSIFLLYCIFMTVGGGKLTRNKSPVQSPVRSQRKKQYCLEEYIFIKINNRYIVTFKSFLFIFCHFYS